MNQAKNLKINTIIARTAEFIIYFTASGFTGVICAVIFNSFMRIAFRDNPLLKDMLLYIINLLVISAALCFFSMREGYTDTQNLRYSFFRTGISYFAAGAVFFASIILADIHIFPASAIAAGFKEHFLQPFYADENINNLLEDNVLSGYFISGILVLLNIGILIASYKAGRLYWIARKRKRVRELRAKYDD